MGFVNKLNDKLVEVGARNISYSVVPFKPQYDLRYYYIESYMFAIPVLYPIHDIEVLKYGGNKKRTGNFNNIIEVRYQKSGQYLVNGKAVELGKIKSHVKQLIQRDSNNIIKITVDGDSEFGEYIKILSRVKKGIA